MMRINLGGALVTRRGRYHWRELKRKRRRASWWSRTAHERARHAHSALIKLLGGRCAKCRSVHRLEVDHIDGRTWRSNSLAFRDRVRRYWKEYKSGVLLRVLCRRCNGSLGARITRRYAQPAH